MGDRIVARKKNLARNLARKKRLNPLAGLVALGLASSAIAVGSNPFPTFVPGLQQNNSYIVASGQVLTPAGTQVTFGETRAKALALHPTLPLAAVLTMSNWGGNLSPQAGTVHVFNTQSGPSCRPTRHRQARAAASPVSRSRLTAAN